MKKASPFALAFLLCIILTSCVVNNGITDNVEIDYGTSQKFSTDEIESAVDIVLIKFLEFDGCDLKKVYYDEEKSNAEIEGYMKHGRGSVNGVGMENVIIIYSDFSVGPAGGEGGRLNANSTYRDWFWILTRGSETDIWELDDWGY